jgi:hypothetical protein
MKKIKITMTLTLQECDEEKYEEDYEEDYKVSLKSVKEDIKNLVEDYLLFDVVEIITEDMP